MFGYFSPHIHLRAGSDYRRIMQDREGDNVSRDVLNTYTDPDSANYKEMIEEIRKRLGFTTLRTTGWMTW